MALKDIIGQEKALEILRGCIRKSRIPHALLFAGEDGIGKRLTAINFAKTLNCRGVASAGSEDFDEGLFRVPDNKLLTQNSEPPSPVDSCDQCPSCRKADKLFNPDTLITPGEDEKTLKEKIYISHPDVALIMPYKGVIRVEGIRRLQESLSYKPFEGEWKIAIIDNAERLNPTASNAFLETLESPPAQCILIMVTSRPDMLLATIRSRCQRINFSPLPLRIMRPLLEERVEDLDHDQSMLLSMLSGGKLGYALNDDLIMERDRFFDEFREILDSTEKEVWEDRDAMERWFDWCQLWLRDIAVFRAVGRTDLLINHDRAAEIREISQKADLRDILKLARKLYRVRGLLNFNLNKQLTLNYTGILLRKMLGSGGL